MCRFTFRRGAEHGNGIGVDQGLGIQLASSRDIAKPKSDDKNLSSVSHLAHTTILVRRIQQEFVMPHRLLFLAIMILLAVFRLSHAGSAKGQATKDKDQVLFTFTDETAVHDWVPMILPEVAKKQPAPKVEIVSTPKENEDAGTTRKCLKITFDGGDWPVIGTTKIAIRGNWKQFQTLKASLIVDRPSVAYVRIYQGKADAKPRQPRWEKTMILDSVARKLTFP